MIRSMIRPMVRSMVRPMVSGDGLFSPIQLFANSEQGAWYDPSDLSTLFQDAAGTIPVTADGQPVGLMLDKSRGLELGDERVTDENFTVVFDSSSNGTAFNIPNNLESGEDAGLLYLVSFNIISISEGKVSVRVNTGGTTSPVSTIGVSDLYVIVGSGSATSIRAHGTTTATISNFSIKEVLGNHASQPVAAARPTYNDTPDRLTLDKVDDSIVVNVPVGGWVGSMVIGTNEGTASYGVTIPAGDYAIGSDYFAGSSINGVLIRDGVVSASDLAKVEQDFVDDGAKASYGDVTNFSKYWRDKNEITSFPIIDTSSGTGFIQSWFGVGLTSFPLLDVGKGGNFLQAWRFNQLTDFPLLNFTSAVSLFGAFQDNPNLTTFPANMFDNCLATSFNSAFTNTNLSQSSIDGILVSINSNNTSNGTFDQSGGSDPSATGEAAIAAMRSRGWTITATGGF